MSKIFGKLHGRSWLLEMRIGWILLSGENSECYGLPLLCWVVYLPSKLQADNCLSCSSTTATAMDPVIVMHISGTNLLSSPVNFIFCIFSQNSCSSSMSFSSVKVICRHVSSLKLLALPFLYSFHVDEISCSQFLKLDISNINT